MQQDHFALAVESVNLLIFTLAGERYALPVDAVREVLRWRAPTPIPCTPPSIPGVLHHRGAVLPVVDPRPLLGLSMPEQTRDTRLLVVEAAGVRAALVCDAVADIAVIDRDAIEPPSALPAAEAGVLSGVFFYERRPTAIMELPPLWEALTASRHVHT
jgi:purine-binding chemotaxis protein CheW